MSSWSSRGQSTDGRDGGVDLGRVGEPREIDTNASQTGGEGQRRIGRRQAERTVELAQVGHAVVEDEQCACVEGDAFADCTDVAGHRRMGHGAQPLWRQRTAAQIHSSHRADRGQPVTRHAEGESQLAATKESENALERVSVEERDGRADV